MKPSRDNNAGRQDVSAASDVVNFLQKASKLGKTSAGNGGLIFALDATMSRQHTWDQAQQIQGSMFDAVGKTGGLDVQLVYFRGFGECRASRWVADTTSLRTLMTGIECRGGQTQIGKILSHAQKEAKKKNPTNPNRSRVDALVFVGDAMEEEVDVLCNRAGQLGLLGVPCFMFQDGHDPITEQAFREISRLSNGAFIRFGTGSAARLAELLRAVASFVSGGAAALEASGSREAKLLLEQMK
ncbi:MAG: VWA domain-containing protein [Rhizobiaceae bacterium]|nr:VWA domain-containing protein [Rhizobiaceae bacterium]